MNLDRTRVAEAFQMVDEVSDCDSTSFTIHHLATQIAAGALSPVEIVDQCLRRIKQSAQLNAFVQVFEKEARRAAEIAHKNLRRGLSSGPLYGVPVAVKDNFAMADKSMAGGSGDWRRERSSVDAAAVKSLVNAGAIVIGKTQTVEFAFGGWGINRSLGTPVNPADRKVHRVPGGSSSGSAVAVAAGLVPASIGSDTGGSIRLPASFCGIVGLKTTVGSLDTDGLWPLSPTLDTVGPMARTVEDAALLFGVMRGTTTADRVHPSRIGHSSQPLNGLTLGCLSSGERRGVAKETLEAYDHSLAILSSLGATIERIAFPFSFPEAAELTGKLIAHEGFNSWRHLVSNSNLPIDPDVRASLLSGERVSQVEYLGLLSRREQMKREALVAMEPFAAVLTPTTQDIAIPVAEVDLSESPALFTRFASWLDFCALAIPNGQTRCGLPTSLQIICRGGHEETALIIGRSYEIAVPSIGRGSVTGVNRGGSGFNSGDKL